MQKKLNLLYSALENKNGGGEKKGQIEKLFGKF
jgi:hypothetical protein